jgi:acyl dehydratase
MLNGGVEFRFQQPMRPGDVISGRWRVKDATEREGRMGQMLYIQLERELRNQHDELVRTRIDTVIRY